MTRHSSASQDDEVLPDAPDAQSQEEPHPGVKNASSSPPKPASESKDLKNMFDDDEDLIGNDGADAALLAAEKETKMFVLGSTPRLLHFQLS